MALYLCSGFCILYILVLEKYVFQVEGGPHLLKSFLHVTQDDLPLAARDMHLSFESLVITNTLGLQSSFNWTSTMIHPLGLFWGMIP